MLAFWIAIGIFLFLFIYELIDWGISIFRVKENFITRTDGILDYPECMNSTELDNHIKEEEAIRSTFGYRKLFDSTLKRLKLTRDAAESVEYQQRINEHGITDVTSYDTCHNPEIYRRFYFVPFGERKYKRNYPELNEVR